MRDVFQEVRCGGLSEYYSFVDEIDINVVDEDGGNLLHTAIAYGKKEIALDLIARGIDVNQRGIKGETPLQYALGTKEKDLARAIIKAGADVNIRDAYGNNSLWTAVFNAKGNYEFVEMILQLGGDAFTKNNAGRSPLDFAVQIGDQDLVEILKAAQR